MDLQILKLKWLLILLVTFQLAITVVNGLICCEHGTKESPRSADGCDSTCEVLVPDPDDPARTSTNANLRGVCTSDQFGYKPKNTDIIYHAYVKGCAVVDMSKFPIPSCATYDDPSEEQGSIGTRGGRFCQCNHRNKCNEIHKLTGDKSAPKDLHLDTRTNGTKNSGGGGGRLTSVVAGVVAAAAAAVVVTGLAIVVIS